MDDLMSQARTVIDARAPRRHPQPAPTWSDALRGVLADTDRIDLAFQPQVDLSRGVVAGYELLARFPGPLQAPPDRWFAEAARRGVAETLEAAVLTRGLASRRDLPPGKFLSLNVSPAALSDPGVLDVLRGAGGLGGIVLEITEQNPIEDYAAVGAVLDDLRSHGAMIAVDDVGAGYASLAHVMALRPQFVKLDRALVADVDVDPTKLVAVQMFGELAGSIDAWLLAEGTERVEEVGALLRAGVPLGQGYWLGRPGPTIGALSPDTASALGALGAQHARRTGIGRLTEAIPTARTTADAAALLLADPSAHDVVIVDEHHHPVGFVGRDRLAAGLRPVLLADVAEDARDLGPRMASRPALERYDPAVVCEEDGRCVGVVRMDGLVLELARRDGGA